jgi:hypothetical protein
MYRAIIIKIISTGVAHTSFFKHSTLKEQQRLQLSRARWGRLLRCEIDVIWKLAVARMLSTYAGLASLLYLKILSLSRRDGDVEGDE